jgi:hypothetical protein
MLAQRAGKRLLVVWFLGWLAAGSASLQAGDWANQRVVGPVVCRADFSLAPYEGVLTEVAALQHELERTLALPVAREPVEVYLFRNEQQYAEYLRHRYPQAPYRRAMFVKASGSPGQVFVFGGKELSVDLRHESTHAFLNVALPQVPLWLDEGLAEYFEVPAAKRAFENPHLSLSFRTEIQFGRVPRLADLEGRQDLAGMSAVDYRNAWAWVHFMFHGPRAAHEELVDFVAEVAAGREPTPLSVRLRQRLPQLNQAFLHHFRTWQRR